MLAVGFRCFYHFFKIFLLSQNLQRSSIFKQSARVKEERKLFPKLSSFKGCKNFLQACQAQLPRRIAISSFPQLQRQKLSLFTPLINCLTRNLENAGRLR